MNFLPAALKPVPIARRLVEPAGTKATGGSCGTGVPLRGLENPLDPMGGRGAFRLVSMT